jgi:hypothetical protein
MLLHGDEDLGLGNGEALAGSVQQRPKRHLLKDARSIDLQPAGRARTSEQLVYRNPNSDASPSERED